jgi:hypothetical protein
MNSCGLFSGKCILVGIAIVSAKRMVSVTEFQCSIQAYITGFAY